MLLPETKEESIEAAKSILVDKLFSTAGSEVVVEQHLTGEEVSVLAFCDGEVAVCMPAAQVILSALEI